MGGWVEQPTCPQTPTMTNDHHGSSLFSTLPFVSVCALCALPLAAWRCAQRCSMPVSCAIRPAFPCLSAPRSLPSPIASNVSRRPVRCPCARRSPPLPAPWLHPQVPPPGASRAGRRCSTQTCPSASGARADADPSPSASPAPEGVGECGERLRHLRGWVSVVSVSGTRGGGCACARGRRGSASGICGDGRVGSREMRRGTGRGGCEGGVRGCGMQAGWVVCWESKGRGIDPVEKLPLGLAR
eukprot:scaffold10018_cov117-Isochrysis_galbana.AAC.5